MKDDREPPRRTPGYRESWDGYWREVTPRPGVAFWDSMSDQAVRRELPLFQGIFDLQLPLVDVGCGNGTQTLASRHIHAVRLAPLAVCGASTSSQRR